METSIPFYFDLIDQSVMENSLVQFAKPNSKSEINELTFVSVGSSYAKKELIDKNNLTYKFIPYCLKCDKNIDELKCNIDHEFSPIEKSVPPQKSTLYYLFLITHLLIISMFILFSPQYSTIFIIGGFLAVILQLGFVNLYSKLTYTNTEMGYSFNYKDIEINGNYNQERYFFLIPNLQAPKGFGYIEITPSNKKKVVTYDDIFVQRHDPVLPNRIVLENVIPFFEILSAKNRFLKYLGSEISNDGPPQHLIYENKEEDLNSYSNLETLINYSEKSIAFDKITIKEARTGNFLTFFIIIIFFTAVPISVFTRIELTSIPGNLGSIIANIAGITLFLLYSKLIYDLSAKLVYDWFLTIDFNHDYFMYHQKRQTYFGSSKIIKGPLNALIIENNNLLVTNGDEKITLKISPKFWKYLAYHELLTNENS